MGHLSGSFRRYAREMLCAFLVFLLFLPVFYADVFVAPRDPKLFGGPDCFSYFIPAAQFQDYAIRHGEFPLWNPLILAGTPHAANPQTAAFYPPSLLRSLLTPEGGLATSRNSLLILTFSHLLIAFLGMYFYAASRRASPLAAFVAAYVYSCVMLLSVVGPWVLIVTSTWLPLVMYLHDRLLASETVRARIKWATAEGLLMGLCMLGGYPCTVAYAGVLLGAYTLAMRLSQRRRCSQWWRTLRNDALGLTLAAFTAGMVSMALLLPAAELAMHGVRGKGSSVTVQYWPDSWKLLPAHVHVSVLLLAGAAFWTPRRRLAWVYVALCALFLDLFLGLAADRVLRAILPFQIGSPNRAALFLLFPLALLAGLGVDALKDAGPVRKRLACVILLLGVSTTAAFSRFPLFDMRGYGLAMRFLPLAYLIPLAGLAFLPVQRLWWRRILVVAVVLETAVWANLELRGYFVHNQGIAVPEYSSLPPVMSQANTIRSADAPNWNMTRLELALTGYEPAQLLATVRTLCSPGLEDRYLGMLLPEHLSRNNYRSLLFLKRSFWLAQQYAEGALPDKPCLFPPATTVYLDRPPKNLPIPHVDGNAIIGSSISFPATERSALPVAVGPGTGGASGKIVVGPITLDGRHSAVRLDLAVSGPMELRSRFQEPSSGALLQELTIALDGTEVAEKTVEIPLPDASALQLVVDSPPRGTESGLTVHNATLLVDSRDETSHIRVLSRTANTAAVRLTGLPAPRLLLFVDALYPGWKAFIDGQPCPIIRANDAFKAVVVPAGTHDVMFRFMPWRVGAGVALSLFAVAFVSVVWFWPSRGFGGKSAVIQAPGDGAKR